MKILPNTPHTSWRKSLTLAARAFTFFGGGQTDFFKAVFPRSAIFLALALLSPNWAFAQIGYPCNQWGIEVCEVPQLTLSIYDDPSCEDNCNRVHYQIYLVKIGSQNDTISENVLRFNSLTLEGTLAVSPVDFQVTGARLSEVNLKETMTCTPNSPGINNPNAPNSPVLSYDASSNEISYEASSNSGQILMWPVFERIPLFTLAVDVFPGEEVELTNLSYTFVVIDSNSNPVVCTGGASLCSSSTDLVKTIELPDDNCSNSAGIPVLRIGNALDAPAQCCPMRQKMPVWVSTQDSALSWGEIDFLMTIDTAQYIQDIDGTLIPRIEGGLIPASSVKVYKPIGSVGYRIYAHHISPITVHGATADSTNTLFHLVFDGPQLESQCAEIEVGFTDYRRMDGGDFDYCKPMVGNAMEVLWDAVSCAEDECPEVVFKAARNLSLDPHECNSTLLFDLFVSATQNTAPADIRCVIEIGKTGTFTLNTSETSSDYCSPASCITVTDLSASLMRVEYAPTNLTTLYIPANNTVLLATVALTTTDNGCIESMVFRDAVLRKDGDDDKCLARWESEFPDSVTTDDICAAGKLEISAETESGEPIEGWRYYVNYLNDDYLDCKEDGYTGGATMSHCVCLLEDKEQNVVLQKKDFYLNGVTTYDLVLIQKHILGLEYLSSGFKILAGDANMSGSLSTFDILELRKLILGIYDTLPIANSWRFIDKDLESQVQGSSDPFPIVHSNPAVGGIKYSDISQTALFADEEFDEFALPTMTGLDGKAEFVGFKVGDVNNTAIPNGNLRQAENLPLETLALGTKTAKGRAGEQIELPVFGLAQQPLSGWQMALQFDTALLQVNAVRWASDIPPGAPQTRGWHLAAPGELRLLWLDGEGTSALAPDIPLFFVQATLRRDTRKGQQLLHLAEGGIPQEAYGSDLRRFALRLETSDLALLPVPTVSRAAASPAFRLAAYPNPAAAHFRLKIEADIAAPARLAVRDLLGREVANRILDLVPGLNTVAAAQLPALASGQYFVSLFTPTGVETLRLVIR